VRLIFLGSPGFALPSLEALRAAGHDIALVVTQPDRPAGRGKRTTPPAVAAYAREHYLPLWQTASLRGAEAEERLRGVGADGMALAAFAALVPRNILDLAPILNVHPSLLPRWRGAAPIQAALLAGDAETGVSIIRLVQAMDAGPILLQERVPIAPEDDYLTLEPKLAELGARMLVEALQHRPAEKTQDDALATYSRKIERDDGRVDWSRPANEIWRQVRAYRGWPQAFTTWDGKLLKILRAWPGPSEWRAVPGRVVASRDPAVTTGQGEALLVMTGAGALRLDELVLEGRRPQSGSDFQRGYPQLIGSRLA
jgi:methionyl-tRNA formyltransferase